MPSMVNILIISNIIYQIVCNIYVECCQNLYIHKDNFLSSKEILVVQLTTVNSLYFFFKFFLSLALSHLISQFLILNWLPRQSPISCGPQCSVVLTIFPHKINLLYDPILFYLLDDEFLSLLKQKWDIKSPEMLKKTYDIQTLFKANEQNFWRWFP